jgi:hypothetical protein
MAAGRTAIGENVGSDRSDRLDGSEVFVRPELDPRL